ncbi:RNA-directed DNA polymerase, eukaryota, Reverse transcriptase zinc-binding domain protein [Artemisia annua]|uniref:RNA-directed DNA polymerase, eukaryota, Reverse transcriptase zinc-binding domain protein n=1 Tax=Artemisia annua TaxID=35608 RepID=A0A2U1N6D5_ARTAN|nr:RNA-directed DNA polymerase, eukaryota, Reverse transcriptase zinc-binding domain protein [Artemisia annua]
MCRLNVRCHKSGDAVNLFWSWRRQLRDGRESDEFNQLKLDIQGLLLTQRSDGWRRGLEGSGDFKVRTMRSMLDDKTLPSKGTTRCNTFVPKKDCVFIWRAEKDRLLTRNNLDKRNVHLHSLFLSNM